MWYCQPLGIILETFVLYLIKKNEIQQRSKNDDDMDYWKSLEVSILQQERYINNISSAVTVNRSEQTAFPGINLFGMI